MTFTAGCRTRTGPIPQRLISRRRWKEKRRKFSSAKVSLVEWNELVQPNASLLLVSFKRAYQHCRINLVTSTSGLYYFGPKFYVDVPTQHVDVQCISCYRGKDWTQALYVNCIGCRGWQRCRHIRHTCIGTKNISIFGFNPEMRVRSHTS